MHLKVYAAKKRHEKYTFLRFKYLVLSFRHMYLIILSNYIFNFISKKENLVEISFKKKSECNIMGLGHFAQVPRLLNRVYDKTLAGVNGSALKRCIYKLALSSKTKELERWVLSGILLCFLIDTIFLPWYFSSFCFNVNIFFFRYIYVLIDFQLYFNYVFF